MTLFGSILKQLLFVRRIKHYNFFIKKKNLKLEDTNRIDGEKSKLQETNMLTE